MGACTHTHKSRKRYTNSILLHYQTKILKMSTEICLELKYVQGFINKNTKQKIIK